MNINRSINQRWGVNDIARHGADALKKYNPNDKRTHPAVAKIIAERGDRAGFVVCDGILFQLTVGLFEERGVCAYYPMRGASLTEIDRIAKCFGIDERDVPNVIFWNRSK